MRLSIDKGDPGYCAEAEVGSWEITLDGEKLENCVMADEEKGEAIVLIHLPEQRRRIRKKVCGKVVIKNLEDPDNAG